MNDAESNYNSLNTSLSREIQNYNTQIKNLQSQIASCKAGLISCSRQPQAYEPAVFSFCADELTEICI
ncbi:MAG: hypothetical protein V8T10_05780 [Merdibacter sp.]